jgi:phosphoserine aminotransferase
MNWINELPKEFIPTDPRFGVGPSLIPTDHLQRLAETGHRLMGTSHRKPAVKNLVKEVQSGISEFFQVPDDYQIILGNGGATFLWDMIGTGMVEKASYHYVNGEFSQKWFKAHDHIPWIKAEKTEVDYSQGVHTEYQEGYDVICTTLNETSTGVQIDHLPAKGEQKALLAMDATSGAGQLPVNLNNVDFFYFSPQKVLAGEGGLFIGIISPRAIERVLKIAEDKNRYIPVIMDWKLAIDNSAKNQTYNTPAVANLFFINESLKKMNALGSKKVYALSEEKAQWIYQWAEEKNYLSPYVTENQFRSKTVATIDVDENIPVNDILKVLREHDLVYDIESYRKLGRNQFRIGLFHHIEFENLKKLTQLISFIIEGHY